MRDTVEMLTVDRRFSVDTTFVLFFLAVDLGQGALAMRIDTIVSAVTLVAVLVLPYFMAAGSQRPVFANWLAGRILVAGFAIGLGMMFQQAVGSVLPEMFRYLPMTLLILSAMVSFYLQFYAIMRFRLAR